MTPHDKKSLAVLGAVVIIVGAAFGAYMVRFGFWKPTGSSVPNGVSGNGANANSSANANANVNGAPTPSENPITVVATGLDTPWDLAVLPDGDLIVTERPGTLRRIGKRPAQLAVADVTEVGEGGLMGLALHPDFATNHELYLAYTTKTGNVVARFTLDEDAWKLSDRKIIIGDIPKNQFHDGGRIRFGPDGMLYVTTGDAGNGDNAQDPQSLAGKILRVTPDGGVPAGNPFGNLTWSYGHRNPQGITWDDKGTMWETEHGPSGAQTGYDEVNQIVAQGNYGWPRVKGDEWQLGIIQPKAQSGANETWAPASIAFLNGKLYFAGLRGESLYEAKPLFVDMKASMVAHFRQEYGRLRGVTAAGGFLYVTTSNRDSRGTPKEGDDKILRIDPRVFDVQPAGR